MIPIVYPGARTEQFRYIRDNMPVPVKPDGSKMKPIKACFAGLLMSSKGVHTAVQAAILLNKKNICTQLSIAGDEFQRGYKQEMEDLIIKAKLDGAINFVGQLSRTELARFYALHHIGIFPSIHPEAFGIVAVEMMATGLPVISSCVGGAGEVVENEKTGLKFEAGNYIDLANKIERLIKEPEMLKNTSRNAKNSATRKFSVGQSAEELERGFSKNSHEERDDLIFT